MFPCDSLFLEMSIVNGWVSLGDNTKRIKICGVGSTTLDNQGWTYHVSMFVQIRAVTCLQQIFVKRPRSTLTQWRLTTLLIQDKPTWFTTNHSAGGTGSCDITNQKTQPGKVHGAPAQEQTPNQPVSTSVPIPPRTPLPTTTGSDNFTWFCQSKMKVCCVVRV